MTDEPILDVIDWAAYDHGLDLPGNRGHTRRVILAALRDARYEVVPTDVAKLGRAVGEVTAQWVVVDEIYRRAGIVRGATEPVGFERIEDHTAGGFGWRGADVIQPAIDAYEYASDAEAGVERK